MKAIGMNKLMVGNKNTLPTLHCIRFNAMITGDCTNESDWNELPE